jgi:hypothetical protein
VTQLLGGRMIERANQPEPEPQPEPQPLPGA